MVSSILILAIGLGTAFGLGLLNRRRAVLALGLTLGALGLMAAMAVGWLIVLAQGAAPVEIYTAGAEPPFAINLRMGLMEAGAITLITLTGLLAVLALRTALTRMGRGSMAVVLVLIMALSGLVMTRDVFNLFVFLELMAISTGGLALLSKDIRAIAAGFKYLIISQLVTILLLVGIIFTYHATGSLNIDDIPETAMGFSGLGLALFLILIAVVLELKPFPANGWALDVYTAAHPGFSAVFSAASGTAMLVVADKLVKAAGPDWFAMFTLLGLISFIGANIVALRQDNDRRLLGYSSVGQLGLLLAVIGQQDVLGEGYLYVAGGLVLSHAVAKAGLFWMSIMVKARGLSDWAAIRVRPPLVIAFATFLAMLTGLPPFPGFYAKWELAQVLATTDRLPILAAILIGTLIEAVYLFRWFGMAMKRETDTPLGPKQIDCMVVLITLAAAFGLGALWGDLSENGNLFATVPMLAALFFLALEPMPAKLKNGLAIMALVYWFAAHAGVYDPMRLIFLLVMILGGAVILLASFNEDGRRVGFYPPAMLMYAGLALLLEAQSTFEFFAAWEVMTLGSYFLILRGKQSEPHALSYMIFSLGGAFVLLSGFALAADGVTPFPLSALSLVPEQVAPWVFALLAVGFMTKTASVGVHIWLPGAHAEAETDVSPMVSGILLKAGLYGLVVLLLAMGRQSLHGVDLVNVLAWIGAISAFVGAVLAVFQEDAKRLLAYSSISQMGYALFGLALMNHLGWLLAVMFVINHYVYKSMLFLAVGGVYKRTHTKLMYKMGGLITLMPFTFVSVLVGIIAMSGVPPLSGFGGRWIFYNAILETDLRLPLVLIFMSGPVGFLYLFRLIHTIFLGQLKDENHQIKEAPIWLLVPQMIFVAFLIGFAIVPGLVLQRVDRFLGTVFGDQPLIWHGRAVESAFGNWNPVAIMVVIVVIFVTLFGILIAKNHDAVKVKQFNIVFSAERPYRPETTHFAWNFFAPYRRAMGFMEMPLVTRFWGGVSEALSGTAEFTRKLYSGNGQTYAVQVILFVVTVYLIALGGVA
ncbi:formate hydrogenlyase subunit 3/multisubunit Na+/H+ antiporter MnhD subunit [Rhodobacter aestuarii]|uniref:Formate hydrogenlyase subunit 3/Multisubunit Na+/H+ antiporter, MnhD subunit n=1 Tax=Rhodobacter aestuarii TaxID=453582 RepID=A0A1N7M031_9RHOB|nr:proton-conducting transporter membrane subunit [Rhodobacter aestuarii]PTV94751.1 formate hydrogenlyase subunit 3/multisubunit Na+/H+ antiporter MnhD subunit [Rhodobacter aestuarii]SIS79427.1 Formate hydrogenlyase subunit 3/Multisubunit Na+/H+ antiporter, MnhD subunit [Rhodobacter aestuarii]